MLRIQAFPFYERWTRFALVLCFVIGAGLLPSVVMASSTVVNTQYNDYHHDSDRDDECVTYYSVYRGDTLSRIAARYGVSVYAIAQLNNISNIHRIYPGQYLCIPAYHKDAQHDEYDKDYDKDYGYHKMYGDSSDADRYDDHYAYDDYNNAEYYDKYNDKYSHQDGYDNEGYYGYDQQQDDEHYVYTPGYYESTGGHTGICYYPDPRYDPEDAYYYGEEKAEECYQNYPQQARYP